MVDQIHCLDFDLHSLTEARYSRAHLKILVSVGNLGLVNNLVDRGHRDQAGLSVQVQGRGLDTHLDLCRVGSHSE